mgnify:CR=1 FL=1
MANKFINTQFDLNTTNAKVVYTCPAETVALVKSIQCFNLSSGTVSVSAAITDNTDSTTYSFSKRAMGATSTTDLVTALKVFEESDILKLTATGANFVTGTVEHGGDGPGPQMTATSAQAAQPIKPKTQPYHMGFDFQQAKHKLGTSGQLMPDPRKRTYQGWEFKKGGLAGGKRFGPPPKKGPNPHGKCPFRPDGIRGVGAVEKGRGVKFIGTK